jgi:hypothetical protein
MEEIQRTLQTFLATISASSESGAHAVNDLLQSVAPQCLPPAIDLFVTDLSSLNLKTLTQLRERNQTRESQLAVRVPRSLADRNDEDEDNSSEPTQSNSQPISCCREIAQKIHSVLKRDAELGPTSGLNRQFRYEKLAAGSVHDPSVGASSGNTANARAAARASSTKVCPF